MTFSISSRHGLGQIQCATVKYTCSCHFTIIYSKSSRNFRIVCLVTHTNPFTENHSKTLYYHLKNILSAFHAYQKTSTFSQNNDETFCIINSKTIFNLMVVNLSSLLWLLLVHSLFQYSKYFKRKIAVETTYSPYVHLCRSISYNSKLGLIVWSWQKNLFGFLYIREHFIRINNFPFFFQHFFSCSFSFWFYSHQNRWQTEWIAFRLFLHSLQMHSGNFITYEMK